MVQLFDQLQSIATDVAKRKGDYPGQIEGWNKYVDTLDKINGKLKTADGESLRYNRKTNIEKYSPFDNTAMLTTIQCTMALMGFLFAGLGIAFSSIFSPSALVPLGIGLSGVGWALYYHIPRLITPKTLKFSMKPEIHIDEMAYVRQQIKGFPPEIKQDPVIKLPEIHMAIPRSWFSQDALHATMAKMDDVKFDI